MELCGHYERWREDFRLVRELRLNYLRYGAPYYKTHTAPGKYDWDFTDETFNELKRLEIVPIVDLCHFGVPDWIGDFQNPDFAQHFAEYAEAFARRFDWVRLYTPINEIFITALFSAQYGWWNERLQSDAAFVNALKNLARANMLAKEAILKVQPKAIFIQSETTEYFHALDPQARPLADFYNQKRFLSLDLCYGFDVRACMYLYLTDNGMTRADYEVITKQYYDRYHLPVMHTETNLRNAKEAPVWLRKQWENMLRLREDGVPIIGFTWHSLTDQVDWDTALREDNGRVNPLGLYDLNRKIRPVGKAYKKLVEQWRELLPIESHSLDMNVSLTI